MTLKRKTPLKRTAFKPKKPIKRGKKPLSLSEITKRFNVTTAALLGPPKPRKRLRKRAIGNNAQIIMFREIWEERERICSVCGTQLVEPPDDPRIEEVAMRAWLSQFAHILNKGHYRAMRNEKRGVRLMCGAHHTEYDTTPKPRLRTRLIWRETMAFHDELKAEANGIK